MSRPSWLTQSKLSKILLAVSGLSVPLSGCSTGSHLYLLSSDSMSPLVRSGDRIIVDESEQARSNLHDGDVIVFRHAESVILKRILAMPGETIRADDRQLFRNGKQVDESYLAPPIAEAGLPTTFTSRMVPPGEIFVAGDNRDRSFDSRAPEFAPVRAADVLGKYRMTYWHSSSAK